MNYHHFNATFFNPQTIKHRVTYFKKRKLQYNTNSPLLISKKSKQTNKHIIDHQQQQSSLSTLSPQKNLFSTKQIKFTGKISHLQHPLEVNQEQEQIKKRFAENYKKHLRQTIYAQTKDMIKTRKKLYSFNSVCYFDRQLEQKNSTYKSLNKAFKFKALNTILESPLKFKKNILQNKIQQSPLKIQEKALFNTTNYLPSVKHLKVIQQRIQKKATHNLTKNRFRNATLKLDGFQKSQIKPWQTHQDFFHF